ncbi:VPA1262 family N-terminal domain-containing protein [Acetobacteraceae bacterium ESL0709]|nr:VPA1262 family N-terminal domain-containing protein [Acetobacteraceae bacterium ESL0697]MDF7678540.1 VPA1262 family N-terminal domain-containing protein [Acetobacteraceae bacterium ESL0709]
MASKKHQPWAVIRLVTIVAPKEQTGRLLCATIHELSPERPAPTKMTGIESCDLKESGEKIFFRRVVLSREEAQTWYRSLNEGKNNTPRPTREEDHEKYDGLPFIVPKLIDNQPWPVFGIALGEGLLSQSAIPSVNPAPFLGHTCNRMHCRYGDRSGFETFLSDQRALAFVTELMHVNLKNYQEYLGSIIYCQPNPVIKNIEQFMAPAQGGHGERVICRIIPRPGESLEKISIIMFDKEAQLLTSFKHYHIPEDGILDIEKGVCLGKYGFVITHEEYGVLSCNPGRYFLREMHMEIHLHRPEILTIPAPMSNSEKSESITYSAAQKRDSQTIKSVIKEKCDLDINTRIKINTCIKQEAYKREQLSAAEHYGQRWFGNGSREEAMRFIQELLGTARSRVMISDPYLSYIQITQFLYAIHGDTTEVTLITTENAFTSSASDIKEKFDKVLGDLKTYQGLSPDIRVISSSKLHDRFLIIDNDAWSVGSSLNSLGEKASLVVKLPNPNDVPEKLKILASEGEELGTYLEKRIK